MAFTGLGAALPAFLGELARNNERAWFQPRKDDYKRDVARPLAELAEAVAGALAGVDRQLCVKLSRPNRDTRFSPDKSPYRSTAWFALRREGEDWLDMPTFFFEAAPERCRWGMGLYAAKPATMAALRRAAQAKPDRFAAAFAQAEGFTVEGDTYRRKVSVPAGLPDSVAELYRRRNIYLCRVAQYGPDILGAEFAGHLAGQFQSLAPLYGQFQGARP